MNGRIWTGDELTEDTTLTCDVCVVGSGAGGSVLGLELAKRGLDVVMLEEGGYHTRRDFDLNEAKAYSTFYQEGGNRATDDLAISIFQGRTVGGGTTINWCACFRTPPEILERWRDVHGVKGLDTAALTPHWDWLEERLSIRDWPIEQANRNNRILWDGLGALGYSRGTVKRNVRACAALGACGVGCPTDAKQSMLVTLIPEAVEKGMRLYANASVRHVSTQGTRVTAVHADVLDPATSRPTGKRLTVKAKVTAVCGGAINSPGLLLRSQLTGRGNVGKRLFLHPVVISQARFRERVEAYSGAPLTVYSRQFIDRGPGKLGWLLEVPPLMPLQSAVALSGFGVEHQEHMASLPHANALISICLDGVQPGDEGGSVALRDAREYTRFKIRYPLRDFHWEGFREALKVSARIQFAAGAEQVMSPHSRPVVMRGEKDIALLDRAPYSPLECSVVSAHQMGGCAMGGSPETSVVDSTLRYWDLDNLFVVDGSVFPTALGVNPMETILGVAHWGSQHVAAAVGRSA
ncbi:GMC family oxidoreductase [Myxococcus landrumensis]|uniref:GMC family oxidoreductase n=1 Tax=Myxococcus landrumensis TaxID=2813577 RepID=A0ABX7N4Z2_9BACT|nr:GMC family oxidoreductase [Myxococcus landrumus]QSQ13811.1 GMC family oxidoreductase [Myxococcus landrumus]